MASHDKTSTDRARKRRKLSLIILILLVVLAVGDGLLLLSLHHRGTQKAVPAPQETSATQPPATKAAAQPLPTFDIVRVDPQGNAVLAGRAEPGAIVTVKDGTVVLGTAIADPQGEFVLLPGKPLTPGTHEITLTETLSNGKVVEGTQSASINLPGNGQPAFAVLSGPNGSKVVTGQGPQPGQLAMGAVDYDTHGHAIFSGTAPAGDTVTLSLNGQTLGQTRADASGQWHLVAPVPGKPGIITLNATSLAGVAVSPIRVPFAPEELVTALKEGQVVIEPGDNLWMIARKVYGKGVMYTLIYSANATQIHNPNLIFPGQDFVLPTK